MTDYRMPRGQRDVIGLDMPPSTVHTAERPAGRLHINPDLLRDLVREVLQERDAQVSAESSVPLERILDSIRDAVRECERDIEKVRRENALLREEYDLPDPMEIFDRLRGWPVHIDRNTGIVTISIGGDDIEVQSMVGMISAFNRLSELFEDLPPLGIRVRALRLLQEWGRGIPLDDLCYYLDADCREVLPVMRRLEAEGVVETVEEDGSCIWRMVQ